MDGVGSEVSQKIRAAIKAKLVELGAYVDDELPDYIMVMVANKRSLAQMQQDLVLFLNQNTKHFTSWLHSVLQKLQQVTVAADNQKELKKKRSWSENSSDNDTYYKSKKKRSRSKESDSVKSKKKHSKKHKQKKHRKEKQRIKEGKGTKIKNLDTADTTSEWENETDVPKQIGRAIIGSIKEKEKEKQRDGQDSDPNQSLRVLASVPAASDDASNLVSGDIAKNDELNGCINNKEQVTDPDEKVEVEECDSASIIQLVAEPSSLPPTRELLLQHNAREGTSDDSESPEELRRQLLLCRTKQKFQERNLARRMRSVSPEVVIVDSSPPQLPVAAATTITAAAAVATTTTTTTSNSNNNNNTDDDNYHHGGHDDGDEGDAWLKEKSLQKATCLSSVVQVKPREFAPADKQANKTLILKAVAAAERSLAQHPPRREQLASRQEDEQFIISSRTSAKKRNESFIQCWLQQVEEAGELASPRSSENASGSTNPSVGDLRDGQIVVTVDALSSTSHARNVNSLQDMNRISDRFAKISQPTEDHEFKEKYKKFEQVRNEKKMGRERENKNKRLIRELSMKFGQVNRVFDGESADEAVWSRLGRSSEERLRERCRFWPDCSRGSTCDFHHPSSVCKLLPNCLFRDKCLYIHPMCKKDRDCTAMDCVYEHTKNRRSRLNRLDSARSSVHLKRPCKYGQRCVKRDCHYSHSVC